MMGGKRVMEEGRLYDFTYERVGDDAKYNIDIYRNIGMCLCASRNKQRLWLEH